MTETEGSRVNQVRSWNGAMEKMSFMDSTCANLWRRRRNHVNIEFLPGVNLENKLLFNMPVILSSLKSLRHLRPTPDHTSHWETGATVLDSNRNIDTLVLDLWSQEQQA